MDKLPDRLSVDKTDRELYNQDSVQGEIFKDKTRKEQFLFAMAVGFKNKVHRSLDSREGFFLVKDMRPEDEAMIDVVALFHTGSVDVLSNKEEVYRIAEEYARAGIRLLHDEVSSGQPGSYPKKLELELYGIYRDLDFE